MIIDIWMPILGLIDCWGQTSIIPLGHLGTKNCQPSKLPNHIQQVSPWPLQSDLGHALSRMQVDAPERLGQKRGQWTDPAGSNYTKTPNQYKFIFLGYDFGLMDKLYHVLLKLLHHMFLKSDSMINHGLPQKWKKLPFGQKGVFSHHEFHPPV